MSSSFSMANQKLKEFFGGSKTLDYDLSQSLEEFQRSVERSTLFCTSLKTYYELISSLPNLTEKLHSSMLSLQREECCYQTLEYRNLMNSTIGKLSSLVDQQTGRFNSFGKHLTTEQDSIRSQLKDFNESRQKYDHYRVKIEGLMKDYVKEVDKRVASDKLRGQKETLDRNQVKLADAENDYSRKLQLIKERLVTFRATVTTMSFSTYTESMWSGANCLNRLATTAKDIMKFIQTKANGKKASDSREPFDSPFDRVPIEQYFQKRRNDIFPTFQNIFADSNIQVKVPQPAVKPPAPVDPFLDIFATASSAVQASSPRLSLTRPTAPSPPPPPPQPSKPFEQFDLLQF